MTVDQQEYILFRLKFKRWFGVPLSEEARSKTSVADYLYMQALLILLLKDPSFFDDPDEDIPHALHFHVMSRLVKSQGLSNIVELIDAMEGLNNLTAAVMQKPAP